MSLSIRTNDQIPMLVPVSWLAENIHEPDIRILDATVHIFQRPDGKSDARSGHDTYLEEHIPGAQFADILGSLSDKSKTGRFAIPDKSDFAISMESLGIDDTSRVLIYSSSGVWWATRVWWLLRYFGFKNVGVLDGGLPKWKLDGHPVASGQEEVPTAKFTPRIDPSRLANKADVLTTTSGTTNSVLIDVLSPEYYRGELGDVFGYGRLGHIVGAVNLPTEALMQDTGEFSDITALSSHAKVMLGDLNQPMITYCGGGIAATQAAFALELAGANSVRVYSGSLEEWAADTNLPMRTGRD